jgi:hypothetical protein
MGRLAPAPQNTPDHSFYGDAVLTGSRLVDAITYLRSLARAGLRDRSAIDFEIGRLIGRSLGREWS